jgi:uncharacterized membrane protein
MLMLIVGLLLFLSIHLLPTQPDVRNGLVTRFGEGAYKGLFSLVAAAGLVLIVVGYGKLHLTPGKNPQIWLPPPFTRHVAMALMLPVFPLLVSAYLPGRITGAVRHPMVLAVKLWALAHLLVRGDLGSMLLFGGFLAWAVFDRISLKRREAAGLVQVKSGPGRNDAVAVAAGLVIYVVMLKWGHEALIGPALMP